ncbi:MULTISPECIES: hypothetical protein [unclassified Bradyrhizobium]
MTNIPIPFIQKRMGRPPLGIKPTQVRLSAKTREEIREHVGDSGMADFIRRAVEKELKSLRRKRAKEKR